ncbi:cytochrome P450 [Periconia macrospinosa]|uniref:Cytochrome P450 n=1 Tax=Periconia macrospinosa TaxID=97972 RepID=A0A2V1DAQ0_9PLEO|nr:cytochrome P450 [Periconia macrospinosa]
MNRSRTQKLMPLYLPFEMITLSASMKSGGIIRTIMKRLRRNRHPSYGLFRSHYFADNLASADRFLCQPAHTLDNLPLLWTSHVRCFGGEVSHDMYNKFFGQCRELLTAVERYFLSEKNSTDMIYHSNVEAKVSKLVSFSETSAVQKEPLQHWEQYADPIQVSPDAVDVDLARLVRDLTAHVALEVIYGKDFLDRNPGFINDMWLFVDNAFTLLLAGLPRWTPLNPIRMGVAACERIRGALMAYYKRVEQRQRDLPVDYGADMTDVSATVLERSKIYLDHSFTLRQRADLDMGVAFGSSSNTPVLSFWYLVHIYSRPELLTQLRAELAPHVKIGRNVTTGKREIASIDHTALYNDCALFKSGLLETARLSGGSTPIRYVNRSTQATTTDGVNHVLHPGTWVTVPSGNVQKDPHVYPDPDEFVPTRFILDDEGNRAVRFGQLRVFGSGAGVCKGKTYAIKEALAVVAGIISLWDIETSEGYTVEPPPSDNNKIPSKGWRVRVKIRAVECA